MKRKIAGLEKRKVSEKRREETAVLLVPVSTDLHLDDTTSNKPVKHDKDSISQLYDQQFSLYDQQRDLTSADREWFKKVSKEGTAADKCSSLALAIQEAPLYSLPHVRRLGEMAANPNASHHESMMALERLVDVFSQVLLPPNRRLYYLENRPASTKQAELLTWYVEDVIKSELFKMLQTLEKALKSTIAHNREVSARLLYSLLLHNPHEQASNTLALLVNKLGDPERKLASRISYYLEEVIKKHPQQTMPAIQAVLNLCSNPQVPEKALYYAVTFLSQVRFSRKHLQIPEKVFVAYCAFFKKYLVPGLLAFEKEKRLARKKKGHDLTPEEEQKLQERVIPRIGKPLLTGINRALPFVGNVAVLKELHDPLVKLASQGNLNAALPSLSLLHNVCHASNDMSSFFPTLLKITLCDGNISKLAHVASPLMVLLKKVLHTEQVASRNKYAGALLKRLCQLALLGESRFGAALLIIVGGAIRAQPGLLPMISMPCESADDENDTLYELVILAKHPNPLISQLTRCILEGEWDSPLLTRKPLDELLPGSIIEGFVQWRKPHQLLNVQATPEFDFLDDLRPIMEANRPKRRAKDNVRKRTKKTKTEEDGEEGKDEDASDSGEDALFADDASSDEDVFDEDEETFMEGGDEDFDDDDDDAEVQFFGDDGYFASGGDFVSGEDSDDNDDDE